MTSNHFLCFSCRRLHNLLSFSRLSRVFLSFFSRIRRTIRFSIWRYCSAIAPAELKRGYLVASLDWGAQGPDTMKKTIAKSVLKSFEYFLQIIVCYKCCAAIETFRGGLGNRCEEAKSSKVRLPPSPPRISATDSGGGVFFIIFFIIISDGAGA